MSQKISFLILTAATWVLPLLATDHIGARSRWEDRSDVTPQTQSATNQDSRREEFELSADGKLVHSWEEFVGGGFFSRGSPRMPRDKQKEEMGGQIKRFRVMANKDGRLEVFTIDFDGRISHKWQKSPNSGWSGWETFQVVKAKDMMVVRNGPGHLEVFAIQPGGRVAHRWQTKDGWSPWVTMEGGGIERFSSAVFWGNPERLRLFGQTKEGAPKAIERNAENSWNTWADSVSEDRWRETELKRYADSGTPLTLANTGIFAGNLTTYPFRVYLFGRGGGFGGRRSTAADFNYFEYRK